MNPTKSQRTRQILLQAFNDLVLNTDQEKIRVPDVIRRADVGRSTFYDHYHNIDELHRDAISGPIGVLADALVGHCGRDRLKLLLEHFWENRKRAAITLRATPARDQIAQLLDELIVQRLPDLKTTVHSELQTRQLAESTIALLRVWISGEINCAVEPLMDCLQNTARLFLEGLNLNEHECETAKNKDAISG